MKKFELWFPKPMSSAFDNDAETAFTGKTAYICVRDPFDDGRGHHGLVKSKGRILLLNESMSADQCCSQIDSLIADLQGLKIKARAEFAKNLGSN